MKNQEIKLEAKSVMIGRLPRKEGDQFKTVSIKVFNENNPHLAGIFPIKELEFNNIEKVRIRRLNVSYYLEGNDIIVNDLEEAKIIKNGSNILIRGYQGQNKA